MNDIQNDKVKFGIIGCGRIAERHAEHVSRLGKLVFVCDIKKDRADLFAQKYGVPAFYDIEEALILSEEVPDVVSVCTPNGLHFEHSVKALRSGFHVLCEKPMALSVRDCEKMILESEKAGRRLFVVKQNRFNPPIAEVKRLIEKEILGKILSVQLNCFWNRNDAYYKDSDWKGTKDFDGGALFTQFSHFLDLLHWFFGDIEDVHAFVGNHNHPDIEIDDNGCAIVKFYNGILGTVHYTTNSFKKNMEGSITIFGTKGTIKIGGQYLNVLEYVSVDGYEVPVLPEGNTPNDYGTYQGSMSNHDKVYENIIDVLKGKSIISTSGIEGLKTVEIINRIYDASRRRVEQSYSRF